MLQLLDALKKAGHETVLYAVPESEIIPPAVLRGHQVEPIALAGDHDLGFLWRFHRQLKKDSPDILHVHSRRGADTFGGLAARAAGIPAVVSRRVDNPMSGLGTRLRFASYARVIAISETIYNMLGEALADKSRLVRINDAIDTSNFVLSPDVEWFRQEFSLNDDAPVIGVVAQLIARKGHSQLLDALPLLLGEHPETKVIFFGRGPLEQVLREKVAAQGLESAVEFAGFRNDLGRIIPCLDMLVHPALAEGMGVAVLEASAAAIPVVAFAAGGVREVIRHGETGLLVEPANTLALADAIRSLLDNKEYAAQLGVAARRRMSSEFSMKVQLERHLALYAEVLAERGG